MSEQHITMKHCPLCGSKVINDTCGAFSRIHLFRCMNRACGAVVMFESDDWRDALDRFNRRS